MLSYAFYVNFPRPSKEETERARELRRQSPRSQQRIWQEIRANRLGFKFRREFPLGPYTLDFYCHEALLCVEVDGDQHDPQKDKDRDDALACLGIHTLRLSSRACAREPKEMALRILHTCIERTGRDPFPSPARD
jgi:very-short-patch-repair endonuclease